MDAKKRLYPTEKEERAYRRLKEQYGLKDAAVAKTPPPPRKPNPKKRPDPPARGG